ncbi:hypothetical protein IV203_015411 [Nitzschia inconspicua]|uniref:Uncharacterized protein n=1 Tax=Nitzschia inconspicua TaxID=303405 RepID=A0A9K3LAX9_9STRA|nr:hypothetical protein IV203_015411 [Nitzschia inconspicua]
MRGKESCHQSIVLFQCNQDVRRTNIGTEDTQATATGGNNHINDTKNSSILNGVSSPPPLFTDVLPEQQQEKHRKKHPSNNSTKNITNAREEQHGRPQRNHRPSFSLSSLDLVPDVNRAWMLQHNNLATAESSTDIQPSTTVILPSQPSKTYQVFDDLSVRMSAEESPKLLPLDEYFDEKKGTNETSEEVENNDTVAEVVADLEVKGEKVAVAMHDPDVVGFLFDYCEVQKLNK